MTNQRPPGRENTLKTTLNYSPTDLPDENYPQPGASEGTCKSCSMIP